MKKITLVLGLITIILGCSKPKDLPEPVNVVITVPPINPNQTINPNFIGKWNCYYWVVDETTGATHRREFIFSNIPNNNTNLRISLNDYTDSTTFNQIITGSSASINSNYFDNKNNPAPISFKGYLLTDSTMNVYQYVIDNFNSIDTIQFKLFTKKL